jgi:hypothetical protein
MRLKRKNKKPEYASFDEVYRIHLASSLGPVRKTALGLGTLWDYAWHSGFRKGRRKSVPAARCTARSP